jgi:hypothetical protein
MRLERVLVCPKQDLVPKCLIPTRLQRIRAYSRQRLPCLPERRPSRRAFLESRESSEQILSLIETCEQRKNEPFALACDAIVWVCADATMLLMLLLLPNDMGSSYVHAHGKKAFQVC